MVSPRKITSAQRELCKSGFLAITPLYKDSVSVNIENFFRKIDVFNIDAQNIDWRDGSYEYP